MKKPASAEMRPGPGFRIRESIQRTEAALCLQLGQFDTEDISDELNRLYTVGYEIKNLVNEQRLSGPALTVKVFPGDNLMVHKAIDFIQQGDILVIDAGGSHTNAVLGDMIASKLLHRGAAGVIVDGLVRDIDALKDVGLPVFARGVTPVGPLHRGPGEVNFPVSCGGIVVNPGDAIVADASGVVVVRYDFADAICQRLQAKAHATADYIESVRAGKFDNSWVDEQLDLDGCDKQ